MGQSHLFEPGVINRQTGLFPVEVGQLFLLIGGQPDLGNRGQHGRLFLDVGEEHQIFAAAEALHLAQKLLGVLPNASHIGRDLDVQGVAQMVEKFVFPQRFNALVFRFGQPL